MRKLFEFNQHIGRWKVLVQTSDINNKAITREKLSDELWAELCRMAADELLVARYGETTYAEAVYYFENGKILIGFAEGLYYNMVGYDLATFTFTQVDEQGVLHIIKLSADGWSDEISHEEMAMGNVAMEFVDMDEELLKGEETEEVNN